MKNNLLIIGASGHGKVVAEIAIKMKKWDSIFFLDDNENIKSCLGIKVLGKTECAFNLLENHDVFVGIGNNQIREVLHNKLENAGASIPILVHPTAVIGEQVILAKGTVIMAGAVINCATNIGKGCIINTGATVDHDCFIDDFVHIAPGVHLAGSVKIGKRSWLGIGSIVKNNTFLTNDCIIGAGGVVIRDIMEKGTYIGVPVRRIINE